MLLTRLQAIVRLLRRTPQGRVLAAAATLATAPAPAFATPLDTTPHWGGPGVHGIPRARAWDTVIVVEAAGPAGADRVRFVVLTDGTVVAEEGPADGLAALVAAAAAELSPPYRAEAVRREPGLWAVAANAIEVSTLPAATPGKDIVFSVQANERLLRVDDLPDFTSLPAIEALGAGCGTAFVVQASRLAGNLWEVKVEPL
jgi:hypothetical protein